jgi:hypothetical protein
MSKVDLRVDFCSHEAAKYAVEHWHYSRSLPAAPCKVGVWENQIFIGCILFSRGASQHIASPYGLKQTECVELTRIALNKHESPVSKIGSMSIRLIKKEMPGLRLLVSFADQKQNHHGGIYQAMNWVYSGMTKPDKEYFVRGKWVHHRQGNSLLGSVAGLPSRPSSQKHKYLYPLDRAMRRQIEPLAKPYPKRANVGEIESRADTIG